MMELKGLPLSSCVAAGDYLFIGGVTPADENNNINQEWGVTEQTERIFSKMVKILSEFNTDLSHIVFVQIYLRDINAAGEVNDIYQKIMPAPYPARKMFATEFLQKSMLVEFTGIAYIGQAELRHFSL